MLIRSAKDARACIGKKVYWTVRCRGVLVKYESGVLTEVKGRNLMIGGDWKWRPDLWELRDTQQPD